MRAKRALSVAPQGPSVRRASEHPSGEIDAPRRYSRHDVELEVTLESESNFYMGLTENLSEGGLFIATHTLRPLGMSVEVTLKLPGSSDALRLAGTVRWVREYSETSDGAPGVGVRFDEINEETAEQIRAFLASRDPLFYDDE